MRGFKALRAVCLFAGLLVCWLEGLAKHVKVPARGEGPPHSLRVKEIKRLREGPPPYLANLLANKRTNETRALRAITSAAPPDCRAVQ